MGITGKDVRKENKIKQEKRIEIVRGKFAIFDRPGKAW